MSKMMSFFSVNNARPRLGELADRSRIGGESFTLTKHGKSVCMIVPMQTGQDLKGDDGEPAAKPKQKQKRGV